LDEHPHNHKLESAEHTVSQWQKANHDEAETNIVCLGQRV
jgi:hypothetical protein